MGGIGLEERIKERVNEIIIKELEVEESQITPEASFLKDLGADSLDTVELVMEFEEKFDIEIRDEDAEELETVQNAYDYFIKRKDEIKKEEETVGEI